MSIGPFEKHIKLAQRYLVSKNWDLALRETQSALALQPESVDAYVIRAQAYFNKNDVVSSESEIYKALGINGQSTIAQCTYATIKIQLGQYAEAIVALENAISQDSDYWNAYFNLGVAYFRREEYKEAFRMFWKAFALHKTWQSLELALISFLSIYGDYVVAVVIFCVMFPAMNTSLWNIPFSVCVGLYYWLWGTYRIKTGEKWYGVFNLVFGALVLGIHTYGYWSNLK